MDLLNYFEFCNYSSEQRGLFCNRAYFLVGGKEQKITRVSDSKKIEWGKIKIIRNRNIWRARGDGVINIGKISTQEVCGGA